MADITGKNGHDGAVVDGLSRVLADSYSLYIKTHGYHWNVTGPNFPALHAMFEEQYSELAGAVDEIAERIRAVGAKAPAGYEAFSRLSTIGDGAAETDDEMIADLLAGHETVAGTAKETLEAAEAAGDEVTLDLMVQRIAVHDKTAWMLRSTLR